MKRLPQLILRLAAGELLRKRACSGSNVRKFGLKPECRRSLSLSKSRTAKLGAWLECRRISEELNVRTPSSDDEVANMDDDDPVGFTESPRNGVGGLTTTLICG